MAPADERSSPAGRSALREIVSYGLCGGILIALLEVIEARFLVSGSSFGLYGALIACLFAGVGIWLGVSLRRELSEGRRQGGAGSAPGAAPFVPDQERLRELGVTTRELEVLEAIAAGLSNREIAERHFVSENTVKTHTSRLFSKLGAKRRTQAVRIGRSAGLIP